MICGRIGRLLVIYYCWRLVIVTQKRQQPNGVIENFSDSCVMFCYYELEFVSGESIALPFTKIPLELSVFQSIYLFFMIFLTRAWPIESWVQFTNIILICTSDTEPEQYSFRPNRYFYGLQIIIPGLSVCAY